MISQQNALSFYGNSKLFEEIHEAKNAFINLLGSISDKIELNDLKKVHPTQKGIKISKGNELEHCPYQVLDLIRDFDPESGLNIRLLHWWGRGMFLFILVGKRFFSSKELEIVLNDKMLQGYVISSSSNPFSYKQLVGDDDFKKLPSTYSFSNYSLLERFQLIKQIHYGLDFFETEQLLYSELKLILFALRKRNDE